MAGVFDPERLVRDYLSAIESGATGPALARFFTPDVVQEEFPNRLMPNGARRDLPAILEGAERGQKVVRRQTITVHNIAAGATVVAELTWSGTLAVPIGSLAAGDAMKARFCIVLELEDGRIRAQRNYDCFEPF
jgi:ketosteroid isomerase-like protein